jgi:tetratricopeptide (TPR) repeat protein
MLVGPLKLPALRSAASHLSALRLCCRVTLLLFISLTISQAQSNNLPQRLERAAALINDDRIAEAERQLNYILRASPNQPDALNLLGAIRAKQGKLDEAESLFKRAARGNNKMVGARLNLAYLYLLRGLEERAIVELKEVLRIEPDNRDAAHKLARLLLSQNHIDECIALIEKARPSPALFILLGDAYQKKGSLEKAEENYLLALSDAGSGADALIGLAQVSTSRSDNKTASLYLARARAAVATSPDLLYRCGLIALRSGIYEEARSAFEQAIRLRPDQPAYLVALGATWLKKPDLLEAEKVFRRALQLQPDSPQAQMYLGYTLLKQKQIAEARFCLEKSVEADNSIPETFYYLGLIAQEQNEDERAIALFEKAIELSPTFAHAHVALGVTCLKMKDYPRARQELETGVKLNPSDTKAHYNLALLFARIKDPQRAQEEMSIVEKLKGEGKGEEQDVPAPQARKPR